MFENGGGVLLPDKCLVPAITLPDYEISSINTGQVRSERGEEGRLWEGSYDRRKLINTGLYALEAELIQLRPFIGWGGGRA